MIIYKITNKINGKIYVGQTIHKLEFRIRQHRNRGKYPIGIALNKYGIDNFDIEIIDRAKSREELDKKEIYWIKYYDCISPKGYNLTKGGEGCVGYKHDEDIKKKLSHIAIKRNQNKEYKAKISSILKRKLSGKNNPNYGKHWSEEVKAKISNSLKGRKVPKESVEKMAKNMIGKNNKAVLCIETNKIYESLGSAIKDMNLKSEASITNAIKSGGRARGYHWKYLK